MTLAFLSIGSNLGDRLAHCRQALQKLSREPGLTLAAVSRVYETEPVGYGVQQDFLNAVLAMETDLSRVSCSGCASASSKRSVGRRESAGDRG